MPAKRWFTLREILSQFMVTMQFPSCHSQLQSGCIGVSDALLLHDGDILALIEWLYGFLPGDLGPGGRLQPPYQFRRRCLDRPSKEASEAAQILVAEAINAVSQLDYSHDQVSCDAEFQSRLRRILDDAGLDPRSPEKEGWPHWMDVTANTALTEALADYAVHSNVTVGQSVEAVAWAREGTNPVIYDARGRAAADTYQPKKLAVFAAPDSGGAAGGAAAAAACGAGGGGGGGGDSCGAAAGRGGDGGAASRSPAASFFAANAIAFSTGLGFSAAAADAAGGCGSAAGGGGGGGDSCGTAAGEAAANAIFSAEGLGGGANGGDRLKDRTKAENDKAEARALALAADQMHAIKKYLAEEAKAEAEAKAKAEAEAKAKPEAEAKAKAEAEAEAKAEAEA
jgi:hypothetical protein